MDPDGSGEVFWMLLSLLSLPVNQQLGILGVPDDDEDLSSSDDECEQLAYLLGTLSEYYSGWVDEFYPNCPYAQSLYSKINGEADFKCQVQAFIGDNEWIELRELAKNALIEAGLPHFPVPATIDFSQYIEIVEEKQSKS